MTFPRLLQLIFGGLFLVLFIFSACNKDEEGPQNQTGVTVTLTGTSTDVTEGGNTDTYSVVLANAPTQDVNIAVVPDAQLTTDKAVLTFTVANWNVAQVVTVAAVDDVIPEGDHTGIITHSSASADPIWTGLTIPQVNVNITDNDMSLILCGSRTGHYVIVDPQTGADIVEVAPAVQFAGRKCLGYLSQKVVIVSPPAAGTFVNVLYTCDRQTGGNLLKITQESQYDVLWVDGSEVEPRLVFGAKEMVNFKDHIYAVNEDGSNLMQLSFDEEGINTLTNKAAAKIVGAIMPSWSPDGTKVACNAYIRELNTNYPHNCVVVMDATGSNKTVVFDINKEETHYRDISWSKDGQFLIFSYENAGRRVIALHLSSLTQSEFTMQMEVGGTAVENLWPSPIENKIVYTIHVPGGGSLYTVNFSTAGNNAMISGVYSQLTDAAAVGHGFAEPDWQSWDAK